jgi:uncharacterized membrane protein SpoIIM required for sporulation
VDIDRYIATHQPTWARLASLTSRAGRDLGRLAGDELDELVRLYQRVSAHLSYAQTYYRDPALTARLSALVASSAAVLHGTRPRTLRAFGHFLAVSFPAAVWHSRRFMLASALLLFVPAVAVALWLANSRTALDVAMPPVMREVYVNQAFEDYYASENASEFSTLVWTNNVRVAAMAFAGGIAGCVGAAYILLVNGASLGTPLAAFIDAGQQPRFWGLILPHGMLELTCIVVAGGAGLALGWVLISPGDRPRAAALAEEGRRTVTIVAGLVLALLVAGGIEGFVTGQPWPAWLRVGIGATAWVGFMAWMVAGGRMAAARGYTGRLGESETSRFALVSQGRPRPGGGGAPGAATAARSPSP